MVWLGSTIGYFLNEEECVTCVETLASDHNGPWSQAKELVLNLKKQVESIKVIKSVQFSCSVMSDSLQPHGLQHTRLLRPSPTSRAYSDSCPSSQWCHPTISSSVIPFSSSIRAFSLSQHQGLFKWVSSSHQVAKVLEFQLQHQSFQWIFRTDFL